MFSFNVGCCYQEKLHWKVAKKWLNGLFINFFLRFLTFHENSKTNKERKEFKSQEANTFSILIGGFAKFLAIKVALFLVYLESYEALSVNSEFRRAR